ncbi:threonine synthase [Saxophila tyrrhenica]|uniref:threonine synthase n=1 Tax=Saxophila tyrrhenica TaxID=1690608 RepID=A0AAV9NZX8_9PEZI|nr:threonine synthase [Saxophila tyrrhenica]
MASPTPSQRYLSTRGGSYDFSFESVVLKGLASDGGLFIPEEIPALPSDWQTRWRDLSFQDLAYEIFSLYISEEEIPSQDLKSIVERSYGKFRAKDVTPLKRLNGGEGKELWLLELFHGPTFAFKDVALQFVGNLFEYFLVRRNKGKGEEAEREHLTVIGATSGDTGSAAIYGLRGKKDVSVFIMHPKGKVSPIQEAQMTTVLDANVHNLAVSGTFDDCQDIVKALFADPGTNEQFRLAAVNSINWARILAQITYYFHSYFSLLRNTDSQPQVRFVVPTGNFGDILAGFFATRMGLPTEKLVVATNENDILHRFWKTGYYEKQPVHGREAEGGLVEDGVKAHEEGVKETLSPAMDILVSSNFERLLWFLAFDTSKIENTKQRREEAGAKVKGWLNQLKSEGGFGVGKEVLEKAKVLFESERVSDDHTIQTIKSVYSQQLPQANATSNGHTAPATTGTEHDGHYVLDPHSAIGVAATLRSMSNSNSQHVALATAHPAKFSHAVELALKEVKGFTFESVLPEQFQGILEMQKRVTGVDNDWSSVRDVIVREVEEELKGKR